MTRVGPGDVRHARRRRRRQARHQRPRRHQPRHPHPARLARSTTTGRTRRCSSTKDPLGNPVDRRHPWNQHTIPQPQKRDFDDKYSWVMSPRWFDGTDHLALDTGGGPLARLWSTALSGPGRHRLRQGDRPQRRRSTCRRRRSSPRSRFEWKIPQWSNTIERNRARTYFQAYAAGAALHFVEKALAEVRAGHTKTWEPFEVPDEGIGCGFTEAVRGVLSHHMVIKGGKIANYHPYPPTPWNANPRDVYGTPGPYEDAVMNTPIFEENPVDNFKGIDIMRTVRSFDPCLPCGVHMYLGKGKVLKKVHSPTGLEPRPSWPDERGDRRHRGAGPPGRRRPHRGAARRAARRRSTRGRGSWSRSRSGSSPSSTAAGSRGCSTVASADAGLLERLVADDLVASLLVLHGLHPDGLDAARRRGARRRCGRSWSRHGGDVEVLDIDEEDGVRPPAAARQLRRLPVVGGHAAARVERGDRRGGARDRASSTSTRRRRPRRSIPVELTRKPVAAAGDVAAGAATGLRRRPSASATAARGPPADPRRRRPRPRPGERCELCNETIADEHEHVVDLESRSLMCTCRGVLAAVHARRRRRRPLPGGARPLRWRSPTSRCRPGTWDALQIPVERGVLLPQLVARTRSPRSTRARPAPPSRCSSSTPGTTSWPPTRPGDAAPDVEALLVRVDGERARRECFVVPDRRLLRAGRPAAPAVAGLRRRQRGARRARRVLRRPPGAGADE